MSKYCKKGIGSKENKFIDRCYWYYNGECLRDKEQPCMYNLKSK